MVLASIFDCPTKIIQGKRYENVLSHIVKGKKWGLITSHGWVKRGLVDNLKLNDLIPEVVISEIQPNPKIPDLLDNAKELSGLDILVALGGGSAIDAAKGIIAYQILGLNEQKLRAHLEKGEPIDPSGKAISLIAIPTTSGSGAEVTRWGTIWGDDCIKHSVQDQRLYPEYAILDPHLCASMPYSLTLASALDALSHSMESIWNQKHTELTDSLAQEAIKILRNNLEATLNNLGDIALRQKIQTASVLAALAMSTTQTALAHSISYPFTAHYDVPHGIACSFTLAEVARYNLSEDKERLKPIAAGLNCTIDEIPEELENWFDKIDVGNELDKFVQPSVIENFGDNLITRARAANNLRSVDSITAREIARAALTRFCS